jgi:hypothetical protein
VRGPVECAELARLMAARRAPEEFVRNEGAGEPVTLASSWSAWSWATAPLRANQL